MVNGKHTVHTIVCTTLVVEVITSKSNSETVHREALLEPAPFALHVIHPSCPAARTATIAFHHSAWQVLNQPSFEGDFCMLHRYM